MSGFSKAAGKFTRTDANAQMHDTNIAWRNQGNKMDTEMKAQNMVQGDQSGPRHVHPGVQKVDRGESRYVAQAHRNQLGDNKSRMVVGDQTMGKKSKGGRP